ncbi:hypothetical protein MR642_08365 [bacterium]|nr:hypothetical protein [bacterium]
MDANIVQGECKAKSKAEGFTFSLPSRRLYYVNIVQGECKAKSKAEGFIFFFAEPPPVL